MGLMGNKAIAVLEGAAALADNTPAKQQTAPAAPSGKAPGRPKIPQVESVEVKDRALQVTATQENADAARAVFGTTSAHFHDYAEKHLLNILLAGSANNESATGEMNALLAMLAGIDPQNEMEAMLAAQMVATHHCAMRTMVRHNNAEVVERWETYGHMATKFARTFTMQLEALARLRRGGKQIVEHVHVYPGGQAVIAGTVNNGRGAK
jgi:hypothetical protein